MLRDIQTGPTWILWILVVVFTLLSILLLAGRGAWLIAGYNTADEEEKSRYDEKKLCRVIGAGMAVIAVLLFIMAAWMETLPAWFAFVFLGGTVADCIVMIWLANTKCKK